MIKRLCIENEYIRKKSQEINADPILVERVIFAFELLSLLIKNEIPLIFKGGTSLMLLIPEIKRLSIDIDIVTEANDETLTSAFNSDLREVYNSFRNVAELESRYRSLDMAIEEFLNDSIESAFLICQSGFKGCVDNDNTKELKDGIKRIRSHIFGGKYSMLQAKKDASRVACLAHLMRDGRLDVEKEEVRKNRQNLKTIKDIDFSNDYRILNKLKKIALESFYLWATALNIV